MPSIFRTKEETFQISSGLPQQYETFEQEWQHGESPIQPHIIDNENSIVDGFDFMQFSKLVPEHKNTALHVFSYVVCLHFLRFFLISFYHVGCQSFNLQFNICISGQNLVLSLEMNILLVSIVNPFTANVPRHVETSQLIYIANQLTGFYMINCPSKTMKSVFWFLCR